MTKIVLANDPFSPGFLTLSAVQEGLHVTLHTLSLSDLRERTRPDMYPSSRRFIRTRHISNITSCLMLHNNNFTFFSTTCMRH